ncbi:predicted SAM-dependent methyltransferase [Longilinea arvoryzae]|uniref:Predicted SAM-dependent methyltransferase n=1 Tax=Longilinea arvoryzae TaxID=360412 RepID=A0A0S7BN09_9CHLR|nr:class I SAM-dependent methyltransferase [Longilinea arvoryzae]GAP15345.1 predicted SAM-dependent methyltransferase [Longilinea arvoryzae]
MPMSSRIALLERALKCRRPLLDEPHLGALRLFNGFTEGCPDLVIDLYANTLILFDYSVSPQAPQSWPGLVEWLCQRLPWIEAVVLKIRNSKKDADRRGILIYGTRPAQKMCENGVWYALDLTLNQDAGLYLDTRLLRDWLRENAAGKEVLNTFAYTGSLGIAAAAGGARRVVQCDLNRRFLELASRSAALNGITNDRHRIQTGDFFSHVAGFKGSSAVFDIVIADPPFFSSTAKGQVDLVGQSRRIINKLRPLVRDGGWLVSINNALFVSGQDYLQDLEELCRDGYLSLERIIPVPEDFTGFPATYQGSWPADPAPFNHPTKIALLRVRRKNV